MGTTSEILGSSIAYALLAALATALLIAAATDLRRREIDNWLNLAIALAAPLFWLASGLDLYAMLFQLGLALTTFAVACGLYVMRQMGGGDVKLLSALALWFVPGSFLQLVIIMSVIGGAASVGMAVFNMHRPPSEPLRNGLSTLAAALWVLAACALGYAAATGRPLVDPQAASTIAARLPAGWLLAVGGTALLGLFAVGMTHIFRRQRGQIPVPYGVAIAAAGLCVLLQDALAAPLSPRALG